MQCLAQQMSSFVPLVSELILSIADVPFSPMSKIRGHDARFGASFSQIFTIAKKSLDPHFNNHIR